MDLFKWISEKWHARARLGDKRVPQRAVDFLPAALEIRERPPHPASRVTAWALLALFSIGVIWACVGEVDIVATAEGKIVPSGQVKTIQPYELGVVSKILVSEGQLVKAGDPLVILDQAQTAADERRLTQESIQNRLNYLRLEQLSRYVDLFSNEITTEPIGIDESDRPIGSSDQQFRHQQILLTQQQLSFRAQYEQLDQQILDKRAELKVNHALIDKLSGTLPLITQRVDALKSLLDKKLAARVQYLELEQERIEQQQDLAGAKAQQEQLIAHIEDIKHQQQSLQAQIHADYLQQLVQLDREFLSIKEELRKAKDLKQKQMLKSPVDGVVQDLAIHTVGGVVTSAQELMKIVPENQALFVEAWIENKDIGFVQKLQPAEIKVHTFPFTKYGIIDGTINKISADAIANDQQGLIYKTNIKMENAHLNVEGKKVALVPGMSVSVEVKTGKRLLIEYILTPLLRYKMDSVEER
ncbi:HlyD family type I secretion periplasmic adaptor subunit [Marinobacterium sp. YM272]|uniref:HlyD family type I secretion periplasmic adaptor subunit n=1 Tax=Marinobacterium sp. YM272 TaxID=3421654 RepID=UPI003D7F4FF3